MSYLDQLISEAKKLEALHESEITPNEQKRLDELSIEIELELSK